MKRRSIALVLGGLLLCSGCLFGAPIVSGGKIGPFHEPYPLRQILDYNAWNSTAFSTLTVNGRYLTYFFENLTDETVAVYLVRYQANGAYADRTIVSEMRVEGGSLGSQVYQTKDKEKGTYVLDIQAIASGGAISGLVGLTQYQEPPDTVVLVPAQDVESTGVWRFPEGILPAPGRGSTLDLTYRNDTDAPATVTLHQGGGEDLGPALLTVEVPAGGEATGQLALEDPTPGVREPFLLRVTPSAPGGAVDGRLSLIQRQETPA